MALPNAYAQYNNSKVLTASPAELTLMLYEGAIKFCNVAIDAVERKDIERAHTNIVKVENIIDYLRKTLDMKYPVAQDFERMYVYLDHWRSCSSACQHCRQYWHHPDLHRYDKHASHSQLP